MHDLIALEIVKDLLNTAAEEMGLAPYRGGSAQGNGVESPYTSSSERR